MDLKDDLRGNLRVTCKCVEFLQFAHIFELPGESDRH